MSLSYSYLPFKANIDQGYLTGGGHSPFAHFYGLTADNLLEASVVAPNGTALTLNTYTDQEYF
jgi:FAD/FMN-containing dehydrogenase